MKNTLMILLFFISLTVIGQIENKDLSGDLISSTFINSDSLDIRIRYNDRLGCMEVFSGRIKIGVRKNKFSFSNVSTNKKRMSCHFGGLDKGIIDHLAELESKGKNTPMCGGTEGNATSVKMKINNIETEFEFCSNNWDGIKELLEGVYEMRTSKLYRN